MTDLNPLAAGHPHADLAARVSAHVDALGKGTDPYILIPMPVYEAARLNMRAALMEHLAGDRRRLLDAPRLGYLTVASIDIRGHSTAQARRMLDWCGRDPRIAFEERPRHSRRGLREWKLPPRLYEILRAEGVAHWQGEGYRVGEIMPRIWGQP